MTMTDQRAIHVVIFDGFADWEPAHALAELRRWGKRTIRTVGFADTPVLSMGGLRVVPDLELASVRPGDVELLMLPGGDLWQSEAYPRAALESLICGVAGGRDAGHRDLCWHAGPCTRPRARRPAAYE